MTTLTRTESFLKKDTFGLRNILLVIAASLFIALCAPIAIPLPFTPIPLAIQAHVCLFLGALLGSKRGAIAVIGFLAQGVMGLPVFANGATGAAWLLGPTGGYLLGYVVGTFVTGYLVERRSSERSMKSMFTAMAIGNIIIFALGSMQLSRFVGISSAIILGVAPFLIGDFFKLCLASRLLKKLKVCR